MPPFMIPKLLAELTMASAFTSMGGARCDHARLQQEDVAARDGHVGVGGEFVPPSVDEGWADIVQVQGWLVPQGLNRRCV